MQGMVSPLAGISERRIGSYRLLRLLMTGQNSQVWEVMHDAQQRRYALKMLLPDRRDDKEQIGYLKNEFAIGSTFDHPRVVRVHEIGTVDRSPYLVLEFYPYPNMKFYIQQDFKKIAHMVPQIIEQAAEGLAYFHSKDLVHRDVKPENYLVSPEGEVKLIDFAMAQKRKTGLAKLFGGKGKIQGTRSYMSPEQIRGQPLDIRSDVYSFGCSIHELVGGKTPFTGNDTQELLTKHLRAQPPSLVMVNSNVTSEFARLVQRLLAKKPEDRPPSMEAFLREFRDLKVYKEPPAEVATRAKERER